MTPAVKIYRNARGEWLPHNVLLNYSPTARLEDALERVRQGGTVFVQPDDAEQVLAAAREGATRGETVS
jgi:hypothetical protein